MKSVKDYPQGAVRTREELESLILAQAKVWEGYGLGRSSFVKERLFDQTSCIKQEFFYYEANSLVTQESMKDFNIGIWNSYNDNFLFTTKAGAEAYVAVCRGDEEQDAAYRAHLAECNALEREFDRLYPADEID